jgi:hypothetical protein
MTRAENAGTVMPDQVNALTTTPKLALLARLQQEIVIVLAEFA